MKNKLSIILLSLFLTACEAPEIIIPEVDCELYPNATVCLPEEVMTDEEDKTEEVLIADRPYNYQNGSEFFDAYFSMTMYLTEEQNGHDFYSAYFRLGELYHYLTDKYGDTREYRFDYSEYVSVKDINDDPTTVHYLSDELYDLIVFSIEQQHNTNGYFDITIDPVGKLWHEERETCTDYYFNENFCSLPDQTELEEAGTFINIDGIHLNEADHSIYLEEGMSLDLGAVAKGYFVERLAEVFIERGAQSFVLSAGGNVKTYGTKPDGSNFTVGIQDPFVPRGQGILDKIVSVPGGYSVVSSGDQEKYFMYQDEIYHHIISPFSLYPDRYSRQVTIVTYDSGLADSISTSTYIMPLEEGMAYIESLDGVEALWVTFDGEIIYTSGMERFLIDSEVEES